MANPNNKDKDLKVDETILDETPPNINEPQSDEDKEEPIEEDVPVEDEKEPDAPVDEPEDKEVEEKPVVEEETVDQKEQRHKAQQTEAQILAARNRALQDKVDEASKLPEPTVDELKDFVAQDGVDWDDLTPFEQSMAKKTYVSEKRFSLVNEAVQVTKKIDEWAKQVDEFIDSTDSKPEFVKLSGHEADFRKFAMKESHRGAAIDSLLLPAFLQSLPATPRKRGSLFQTGGGGEAPAKPGKISLDEAARIRATQGEKAYKRVVQSGRVDDTI